MRRWSIMTLALGAIVLVAGIAHRTEVVRAAEKGAAAVSNVLGLTMESIDGSPVELAKYKGKVVLIVNVASKCGLTPQYTQLEALHEKYSDKGLAVLGFPANEFGRQEPGTNEEIQEFCSSKYNVKFDMFSKVVVKGDGQCELYKMLTAEDTEPVGPGPISWNFEKFLVNREGKVVKRFAPRTRPDDPEVIAAIESELAAQ